MYQHWYAAPPERLRREMYLWVLRGEVVSSVSFRIDGEGLTQLAKGK
jgi:hypothetical protein